jgi:hypothetical protein
MHHDNPFKAADFHFSNKFLPVTKNLQLTNSKKSQVTLFVFNQRRCQLISSYNVGAR